MWRGNLALHIITPAIAANQQEIRSYLSANWRDPDQDVIAVSGSDAGLCEEVIRSVPAAEY
jgi:hypothetical protein